MQPAAPSSHTPTLNRAPQASALPSTLAVAIALPIEEGAPLGREPGYQQVSHQRRAAPSASAGGPLPAAVRRAAMLRDHCRCRAPGCNRRRYVDVHHLTEQAHGGEHSRANCLVLCTTHHRLLHEGKLRIECNADRELCFYDATGAPLGLSHRQSGCDDASSTDDEERRPFSAAIGQLTTHLGTSSEVDGPSRGVRTHAIRDGASDGAPEPPIDQTERSHLASWPAR